MPIRGKGSVLLAATCLTGTVSIVIDNISQLTACIGKIILFPLDSIFQTFSFSSGCSYFGLHLFGAHIV